MKNWIYHWRPKVENQYSGDALYLQPSGKPFTVRFLGKKLSETKLIVTAINKGKRPVYLSSMGLRSGNKDLLNLHTQGLPFELQGGHSHSEWFEAEKLKNRKYDFAWFKDATGKLYKSQDISKKLENYFKSKKEKKND